MKVKHISRKDTIFIKAGRETYPRIRPCAITHVKHEPDPFKQREAGVSTAAIAWILGIETPSTHLSLDRRPEMVDDKGDTAGLLLISCLILRRKRLPKRLQRRKTDKWDGWFHPATHCPVFRSEDGADFFVYHNYYAHEDLGGVGPFPSRRRPFTYRAHDAVTRVVRRNVTSFTIPGYND